MRRPLASGPAVPGSVGWAPAQADAAPSGGGATATRRHLPVYARRSGRHPSKSKRASSHRSPPDPTGPQPDGTGTKSSIVLEPFSRIANHCNNINIGKGCRPAHSGGHRRGRSEGVRNSLVGRHPSPWCSRLGIQNLYLF